MHPQRCPAGLQLRLVAVVQVVNDLANVLKELRSKFSVAKILRYLISSSSLGRSRKSIKSHNIRLVGIGCGTAGRGVASGIGGLRFELHQHQMFVIICLCMMCMSLIFMEETELHRKEAGKSHDHFYYKSQYTNGTALQMSNFPSSHLFCGIGITKLGRKSCTLKVEWRWRNPYKYVSHFISLLAGSSFSYQLDRENNCRADPNSFARTKTYQHFLGLGKVLLLTVLGSDVEK